MGRISIRETSPLTLAKATERLRYSRELKTTRFAYHLITCVWSGLGVSLSYRRCCMGGLLLILAAFFIMGGFHVIGYTALLCAVLFVLFILPAMAITKLLRA